MPELVLLFLAPPHRRRGAAQLEPEVVFVPGADLAHRHAAPPAAFEAQQHAGQVLAPHGVVLGGEAVTAGKRLTRRSWLLPHRHNRRQVGEHRFDAPPKHVLDQVYPVRADVAEGKAGAAVFGLEPPGEVRWLQQPVLQVGAVDEMDRAQVTRGDHRPRLLHHRVAAVVEHHGVDDAGSARRLP